MFHVWMSRELLLGPGSLSYHPRRAGREGGFKDSSLYSLSQRQYRSCTVTCRLAPQKENQSPKPRLAQEFQEETGHHTQKSSSLASSSLQDTWKLLDLGSSPSGLTSQDDSPPGRPLLCQSRCCPWERQSYPLTWCLSVPQGRSVSPWPTSSRPHYCIYWEWRPQVTRTLSPQGVGADGQSVTLGEASVLCSAQSQEAGAAHEECVLGPLGNSLPLMSLWGNQENSSEGLPPLGELHKTEV